jgi:hypothetical protein
MAGTPRTLWGPRACDIARTYGPAALVALTIAAWQLGHFGGLYAASDDSYIYLGYVKRALTPPRALFSYNPGEHSAGTTGVVYYYALIAAAAFVRPWTWFLPLSTTLMLAMWLVNAVLFVGCAGLLTRMVRQLTDGSAVWEMLGLALLVSSVKFMWGMFAGLENPLTAFLVVALAYELMIGVRLARIAALSGLLIGTRPDLAPTVALIPTFGAVRAVLRDAPAGQSTWQTLRAAWRAVALRAASATLGAAAVYGVLVLPCYVLTGHIFPSAVGTRIRIGALGDAKILWQGIAGFDISLLWRNTWSLANLGLLACLAAAARWQDVRVPLTAMAFVALQSCLRIVLRLFDLSAEDRYVSYLWPLYVLAIISLLYGLVSWSRATSTLLTRPAVSAAAGALLAVYAVLGPLREFDQRFSADVREMNQVVVGPARWMSEHLPPSSRVGMEPAGAIRVFTDFYLVDVIGLTTVQPAPPGPWSYSEFMRANRVDYVFDYPARVPEIADSARYEPVMSWRPEARRHSWGEIGVFRVRD